MLFATETMIVHLLVPWAPLRAIHLAADDPGAFSAALAPVRTTA